MSALNIYLDTQRKALVQGTQNPAGITLPSFEQDDEVLLNIYPLDPTGGLNPYYATGAGWSTSACAVALQGGTGTPTGDAAGTYIAGLSSLTWSTDHFTGTLALTSSDVATFLTGLASRQSTFEIRQTDASGNETRYQFGGITVLAAVIKDTSTGPVGPIYPGAIILAPGGTIIIPDATGTVAMQITCTKDGGGNPQLTYTAINPY